MKNTLYILLLFITGLSYSQSSLPNSITIADGFHITAAKYDDDRKIVATDADLYNLIVPNGWVSMADDTGLYYRYNGDTNLWEKFGDYLYSGISIPPPTLQQVINQGSTATTNNTVSITHGSGVNFSQISLIDHFVGISAGDNTLSINPDSASVDSAFGVGAPVNPGDAVRLQDLESATTGQFVPLSGTTSGSPVTGDIQINDYHSIFSNSATNPNYKNSIIFDDGNFLLKTIDSNTNYDKQIDLGGDNTTEISLKSSNPLFQGIAYDIDYSSHYTSRSLPDLAYVQSLIAASSGGTQNLNSVLTNGNTASSNIIFTDTGSPLGIRGSTSGGVAFSSGNIRLFQSTPITANFFSVLSDRLTLGSNYTFGIIGDAYYGANYTGNSFVQKTYVDNYADGKVADNLTASTTVAPSKTAVNAALAGYVQTIKCDPTDGTSITGTTSLSITKSYLIPANTLSNGDINITSSFDFTGTAGTKRMGYYINTTNSISGAVSLGAFTTTATVLSCSLNRLLGLNGSNLTVFPAGVSSISDAATSTSSLTTATYNPATAYYLIVTITLSDGTDSGKCRRFNMTFTKAN